MTLDVEALAAQMLVVFREESEEGLDRAEGLLLDPGQYASREGVDALFRILHTLKGSAGMNGLTTISDLAHILEEIFDAVRAGTRALDDELVRLTLAAIDIFRELIRLGPDAPGTELAEEMADLHERLLMLGSVAPVALASQAAAGVFAKGADGEPRSLYLIDFAPGEALMQRGIDVLTLLEELEGLGEAVVVPRLEGLPPLSAMTPDAVSLAFRVALLGTASAEDIEDVFLFVMGDSRITVSLLSAVMPADTGMPSQMRDWLKARPALTAAEIQERLVDTGMSLEETAAEDEDLPEQVSVGALQVQRVAGRQGRQARQDSMRVSTARLNGMVDLVGELVIAQSSLMAVAASLRDAHLTAVAEQLSRLTADMRDNAMGLRMVAVDSLFDRFRRLVFDLGHQLGKPLRMEVAGGDTELDKSVIDALDEPVLHLIRNCADHGIESPAQRRAAGKPETGLIAIAVRHEGTEVMLTVRDDGAGIDRAAVRERAVARGLLSAEAVMDDAALFALLFEPGFSTARSVTEVSGRGVGLDAVRRAVDGLRGSIQVESEAGAGTRFTLRMPLTLGIIEGLLVAVGENTFVLPLAAVEEVVNLRAAREVSGTGRDLLNLRGRIVPFARLAELFETAVEAAGAADIAADGDDGQAVIVSVGGRSVGVVVDRVIGQHQTVIKSLSRMYRDIPTLAGATILGDGTVALILDLMALVRLAEVEAH